MIPASIPVVSYDNDSYTCGNFCLNTRSKRASRVFSHTIFPSSEAATTPPELLNHQEENITQDTRNQEKVAKSRLATKQETVFQVQFLKD